MVFLRFSTIEDRKKPADGLPGHGSCSRKGVWQAVIQLFCCFGCLLVSTTDEVIRFAFLPDDDFSFPRTCETAQVVREKISGNPKRR